MRRSINLLVLVSLLGFTTAGFAQQQQGSDQAKRLDAKAGAASPRDRLNRAFEAKAPGIGELLPDISVVDADGREFRLRTLRGNHTVIVFGCLT